MRGKRLKIRMIEQKLLGVLLLFMCAVFAIVMGLGGGAYEIDLTPFVMFLPLGFYLIFSRKCWLCR